MDINEPMNEPLPAVKTTSVRHWVVGTTALMAVLLYLDRFCISFAEGFIKEDLGLADWQTGWMLGCFFGSYALGQVPAGWLTDRFGSRVMLTTYVLMWSLFTALTGLAFGFVMLIVLRLGFGFAQAGAYPTGASVVSKWVQFEWRGTASSIVSTGGRLGGFLALYATGFVIVWLTPAATPARLSNTDLLDVPRLCRELDGQGELDETAARVAGQVRADLSTDQQAAVQQIAAADVALSFAVDAATTAVAEGTSGAALATLKAASAAAAAELAEATSEVNTTAIVAGLNRIIEQPDFFSDQLLATLPLEREAVRTLKRDPGDRTAAQSERVNRLVFEAVHPDSVRKIYGAGWRPMMFVYGSLGLLVGGLTWINCRNSPNDHPGCNAAEVALINRDPRMSANAGGAVTSVPLWPLICSFSMWCSCVAQWCTNVGWVFVVTWAPRYFQDAHHVPLESRALMVAIPPLAGLVGMFCGGTLTDVMVRRFGVRWGRALPMSLTRFPAMGAYLYCLTHPSPWTAVVMFSIVTFFTGLGTASVWAYCQDVGGKQVGSILGWGNMWGNFGAFVTPPFLIWIVGPNKNWDLAFMVCAGAFLVSGLVALGVNATIPIAQVDEVTEK